MNPVAIPASLQELLTERNSWPLQKGQAPLAKIRAQISELPELLNVTFDPTGSAVKIGSISEADEALRARIKEIACELIPWRKGPFEIMGLEIDAEWRSELKWERLKGALPSLHGKRVLDVGCNNGYFMFKLLSLGAGHVLGIDPVMANQVQFELMNKFAARPELQFELLGVEHLTEFPATFDVILSMGVLYHHRHPLEQLQCLKEALKKKGTLILESIVINDPRSVALFPDDRYAKMRNVWFVPSVSCLENMLKRCGFKDVSLVSFEKTTVAEQRLTDWCPPPKQSLADFLDASNDELTIEGHPAPYRAIIKAQAN